MSLLPPPRPPLHTRLTHLLSSAYLLSTTSPSAAAHLLSTYYSEAHSRDITATLPRGSGGQVLGGSGAGGGCKRCGLVWVLGWNCHVGLDAGGVVKRGRRKVKVEKRTGKGKSKRKRKKAGVDMEPEPGSRDKDKDKATEGDGEAGPRQRWVEWTCGGCGYVANGELGPAATKGKERKEKAVPLTLLPVQAPTPVAIAQKSSTQTGFPSGPQTAPPVATKAAPSPVPVQTVAPQLSTPLQSANQRAKERKKKKNSSLQEMLAAKRERETAGGGGGGGSGVRKGLGGMDLMDLMKLG
ncbi:hypothetical protein EV426DRAFT_577803 [Tirmania nivea]|nr:hypothetical protein EV426DRAFT_577803 [Tirmania nivea]